MAIPGGSGKATDTNGDGLYDDINGNGRKDFLCRAVLQPDDLDCGQRAEADFDYNGNGRIDFADVVWLFNHIGAPLVTSTPTPIVSYGVPNAAFTANRLTGSARFNVQFHGHLDRYPTGWDWTFGDGATSTLQNPSHEFTESGRAYTVTLRVTNPAGEDPTPATRTITVM